MQMAAFMGAAAPAGVSKAADTDAPTGAEAACTGCGARDWAALVEQGGFRLEALDRFLAEGAPRMFGEMYRGAGSPA